MLPYRTFPSPKGEGFTDPLAGTLKPHARWHAGVPAITDIHSWQRRTIASRTSSSSAAEQPDGSAAIGLRHGVSSRSTRLSRSRGRQVGRTPHFSRGHDAGIGEIGLDEIHRIGAPEQFFVHDQRRHAENTPGNGLFGFPPT